MKRKFLRLRFERWWCEGEVPQFQCECTPTLPLLFVIGVGEVGWRRWRGGGREHRMSSDDVQKQGEASGPRFFF